MTGHSLAGASRVAPLLLRWELLRELGEDVATEELAADAPELIPELARRMAALRAVNAMLSAGPVPADRTMHLDGRSPTQDGHGLDPDKAFNAVVRIVEPRFHARGGLGEVLVARQDELGRRVAVKRIRPDKLHNVARGHFIREAAITAGLQHPGIVPIYALGHDDDGPFYPMPFVEGQTLDEAIRRIHRGAARGRGPWSSEAWSSGWWPSSRRSPTPTTAECCTATSSRRTSCSAPMARPW